MKKYNKQFAHANVYPTFEDIENLTPVSTKEILDTKDFINSDSGSFYIDHFYTNVYVDNDKTVSLAPAIAIDDTSTFYLNNKIISKVESTQVTVFNFKKG
ncbi:hypothetical protein [Paraclostridium dentum]|uniref:hypothetical protein n=1 Tax=Paraclostridium dentum TaxID=2662455 RepID=UPI003F2C149D